MESVFYYFEIGRALGQDLLNFLQSNDVIFVKSLSLFHRQNRFKIDQQIADTIESCNLSVEQDLTCSDCFIIKQNVKMKFQVPKPLALPS
jgi:hypothetical protein